MDSGNTDAGWEQPQWTEQTWPLHEICQDFQSPLVVKLENNPLTLDLGDDVSLTSPFVVYSKRRRTKIYAENLAWHTDRKQYVPSGPVLEIPKDYTGWFDVVKKDEEPPKHHSTIRSIADTGCKTFLSCTTIGGFRCTEEADELKITSEIRVYPGEVLRVLGIITKTWRVNEGANITEKPSTTFLKCFDRKKRQLYLPTAHPGKFCAMHENKEDRNAVYQVGELLKFEFPVLARLVFGWPPPHFAEFTGFIRLVGMNRPDTIVLYSMAPEKCVVLEVPGDIGYSWHKAENLEALKDTPRWKKVIEQCMAKVYPYLITMKCLDVRYFRQQRSEQQQNGEDDDGDGGGRAEESPTKKKMGRMARPVDMLKFNMSEVFPRLIETEQKRVSDSWSLSFKDPELEYEEASGGVGEEDAAEEDEEPAELGGVKMRTGKKVSRQVGRTDSVACDTGTMGLGQLSMQESIAMPRREYTGTMRETKERLMQSREADC